MRDGEAEVQEDADRPRSWLTVAEPGCTCRPTPGPTAHSLHAAWSAPNSWHAAGAIATCKRRADHRRVLLASNHEAGEAGKQSTAGQFSSHWVALNLPAPWVSPGHRDGTSTAQKHPENPVGPTV